MRTQEPSSSRRTKSSGGTTPAGAARARSSRTATAAKRPSPIEPPANTEVIERLLAALRARDEAAVAAELHPDVEAVGARGKKQGIEEVVAWAKPSVDGHLVSSVEADELHEVGGDWIAVAARRLWSWNETGDLADEEQFGVLFRVRDGKVVSWNQTYGSITDAIDAIPAS